MPIEQKYKSKHWEWVDVTAPTEEDLQFLHQRYHINYLLLEDTIDPNHLPKYEEVGDVKFFLTRESTDLEKRTLNTISDISSKLGIFLLPKLIITTHRTKSKSINELCSELDKEDIDSVKIDDLALRLALKIMKSFDDESASLLEVMDAMENEIFLKNTNDSVQIRRLYKLKRKSGLNTRILNMSGEWISKFKTLDLEDVQVMDLIDKQKDVIADFDHLNAQTTNLISMFLALSDQKANQVMKLLAIYSVYFLPITFIAGVYGMNFDNMPELHHKHGYFITIGVMLTIVAVTFIYMRRKRW
ncbi:magnesium transporter CorA family protein [Epilithonimonas lactis]|uniref:Magnesium transporter CorA n=1 Tax=Epilithonimonas lactis TaxID=421072 RepID=A0A085BI39_9FLAO|nr:CorA family divalent cation transporter [Epilithonimonas lactis]KFC22134.1 magnesium transporter CorA [Epilithonimonas lactis]WDF46617.1 CorA family divalent cation transporter [Chryseobacterium sp. KACC 21268]SEQ55547.1 magnesium transporter [Epilithonimonas lactis]